MNNKTHNSDPNEVHKFDSLANRWWDIEGDFKPLHQLNPVRMKYINERCNLAESKILDVGCGGGILSESMAKKGGDVTGIDMGENVLAVASIHQKISKLDNIRYLLSSAEKLSKTESGLYDVVTCMEVLEHVPDPISLIAACKKLTRPGGKVFFSTINRNPKSYLVAILGAEYMLSLLPKGTHKYEKFIKPSELRKWAIGSDLKFEDLTGLTYSIIGQKFMLSNDSSINYLMQFNLPK
ncbi:MAG: bifunctional 2-polyprenyl-6-hydroxyphenol methylase/3-demethylubiquinol 3-O-methyltransferase UbiG [Pseudomonadota bacterium]|nr:bifunctional 2-polyprenyl-6-hydroxyphenol methylase/3-demethylubiquinol 3-O-methyltransferase UbiG [Pseudomonadota bacterium]